jgi:hypothetical protein
VERLTYSFYVVAEALHGAELAYPHTVLSMCLKDFADDPNPHRVTEGVVHFV